MEGWVESYWNRNSPAHSPLVPQDGTDHQQCQQQQQKHWEDDGGSTCEGANKHEQKGIKCMFYWRDSLWTVWLTTTGSGRIHGSCCNFTSVSHPSHRTPGHTKSQGYKVCVYIPNPLFRHFVLLFLLWRTREVSDMGGDKQDQPLQMSFIIFIRNEIKNLEPTSKFQILFLFFQFHRLVKMSDSVLTADLSDKRTIKKKTEGFFITL